MNQFLFPILMIIALLPISSCGQQRNVYNETNYQIISKGEFDGYPYVIVLSNKIDTNYKIEKVYLDSLYGHLLSKMFLYKNKVNGPFKIYSNDKISRLGFYKNGKYDGERITYSGKFISQKAYFKDGVKVGVWEDYNDSGKLLKKMVYENGRLVKEIDY